MKKLSTILFVLIIIFTSCSSEKLDKQTAMNAITREKSFPVILDYDIYCSDPEHARKIQEAGLEKEGFVTIQQTQKLIDAGKPFILFTEKAQSYLMPTAEKDKAFNIQKVKIAEEDLAKIISIKENSDTKTTVVTYTTTYKNVTPFAVLLNKDFKAPKEHTANLLMHDGSWQIQKTYSH